MLSLATGVAVHDMLAGELTSTAISIKWPNDVYVQHQKICGILSEHVTTDGQSGVIVGVGINVNNSLAHAPDDVRFRATSMFDEQQQSFDLTQILLATTARILHRANELAQDAARIIRPFNQNHLLNGRRVTVNSPTPVTGICREVNQAGHIVIATADGDVRIGSGEVVEWQ